MKSRKSSGSPGGPWERSPKAQFGARTTLRRSLIPALLTAATTLSSSRQSNPPLFDRFRLAPLDLLLEPVEAGLKRAIDDEATVLVVEVRLESVASKPAQSVINLRRRGGGTRCGRGGGGRCRGRGAGRGRRSGRDHDGTGCVCRGRGRRRFGLATGRQRCRNPYQRQQTATRERMPGSQTESPFPARLLKTCRYQTSLYPRGMDGINGVRKLSVSRTGFGQAAAQRHPAPEGTTVDGHE